MNIELHQITIRELTENYEDNNEQGVKGYGGKLDIRPPYQREFIYKEKQRDAVIHTVRNNFPLNVMYWVERDADNPVPYEVLDGQQRTISICQYVNGDFMFENRYFHNLSNDEQQQILDYELMVYFCSGTDSEKLDWFETVNIAGEALTKQELRNAVYAGTFVSDAKRYFSKTNCPAYQKGSKLVNGSTIRQEYLETAIKWICLSQYGKDDDNEICSYMAEHQHDINAVPLWIYYQSVINWAESSFNIIKEKEYGKIVKGIAWGELYNNFHDKQLDRDAMEKEIHALLLDDEVQNYKGIIPYVLTREEKYLNLRAFDDKTKIKVYEKQKHKCAICGKEFDIKDMEADHITPWCEGGQTIEENCQMLCRKDNRQKGAK